MARSTQDRLAACPTCGGTTVVLVVDRWGSAECDPEAQRQSLAAILRDMDQTRESVAGYGGEVLMAAHLGAAPRVCEAGTL